MGLQTRARHVIYEQICAESSLTFQHTTPSQPTHSPAKFIPPIYGSKVQYAEQTKQSKPLTPSTKTLLQQVVGTFLYCSRSICNAMLVTMGDLGSEQESATSSTLKTMNDFLDYAATHPCAKIRHYKKYGSARAQ